MKKLIKIILIVILVFGVVFLAYGYYMGAFSAPDIKEKLMGPYTYIYEEHVGDYKNTGPVFERVYQQLQNEGIKPDIAIGIYYDDPKKVSTEILHSNCGFIISLRDLAKLKGSNKQYKIGQIKAQKSVVAEFPLLNDLSYMIAPIKCYPALTEYLEIKGTSLSSSYELYDETNKKIYIVMNIKD